MRTRINNKREDFPVGCRVRYWRTNRWLLGTVDEHTKDSSETVYVQYDGIDGRLVESVNGIERIPDELCLRASLAA